MSQTSYTEFTNSVHNETILKYAYRHYREQINFENLAFFPAYFKPLAFSETLKISEFMSKHAFFSLPEEIFYNQIQRGSKISQKFAEKIHNSKKQFFRETNSKFLSCDYTAYRRIAGIKVQSNFFHRIVIFTNKVMIKFTKFGFVRYRLLRRQIRKIIPIS
jgi:late competence protein required for DNA uptake (superfamily II DNA/RNA helicase)